MVEAVMIWNEPNNMSHWDFEADPGWTTFAGLVKAASAAIAGERPGLPRVLGGISPIDPNFLQTLDAQGAIDAVDRHFYMGLLREDGSPKLALRQFARYTPALGICQWFHFEDPGLEDAVRWLRELGVRHVRTGLSWADNHRPNAQAWFDRQMRALERFDVTLTFCFTPEREGIRPHHTSPPKDVSAFAEFCAEQVRRYA